MIELNKVTKSFKGKVALQETTIRFESGKIHGLVGRNGSGKTVLLKLICGLLLPTNGAVRVDGQIIGKDIDFPPNMGLLIETPSFIPYVSGLKNLKSLARIRRVIGDQEVCGAMQAVGLAPEDRKHVGAYSLGMRQRLGIAQAIMEKPDLLILDEPMNSLDESSTLLVREILLSFRDQGKTILLASHNADDIELLCDTVHKIENGVVSSVQ